MLDLSIPDLTFPIVQYDGWSPWDLRPLLYRGGAVAKIKKVADLIARRKLGAPIAARLPLVSKLHEEIAGDLQGGGSRATAYNNIWHLRRFFAWADETGHALTLELAEDVFLSYTEHLLHRVRVKKDLAESGAYQCANQISMLLGRVLERETSLLRNTRIRKAGTKKRVLGTQADKQNLENTFAFGRALLDITDALTVEAIQGSLPVCIRFRSGDALEEWCLLDPPDQVKALSDESTTAQERNRSLQRRAAWVADTSHRTRYPLFNLRIEAELLIFIAQTGMNLAQAQALKMGKFRYQSHLDGYRVFRVYKGRRSGEVEFEVYSEYRPLFERYLAWREASFPGDQEGLLFPYSQRPGRSRSSLTSRDFQATGKRCKVLNLSFVRPQKLRKTRVNWLLRRSRDPELTAEMDQHTQETLLRVYDQPHHQVAAVEVSRFHALMDPSIAMPGPGVCVEAVPQAMPDAPPQAPKPDCVSPAGCLFCHHQRDLDSEDHVWSLATYRHYKSLELARYRPSNKGAAAHPAEATVERITAKLRRFEASSELRALWC
jgi:Lon protease-like protein